MAWLEQRKSGHFHISFRFGQRKFKKSLGTKNEKAAHARLHRLEENIQLVKCGRLTIPENADVSAFLLSDGQLNGKPKCPAQIRLGNVFAAYRESLPFDALEPNSLRIAGVHMRHFARLLGSRQSIRSITAEQLQRYVTARSHEPGLRGKQVSAVTIKKELATFSTIWTWAAGYGYVSGSFPKQQLKFPKLDEKPPFQTWSQIQRQIESGGLNRSEQQSLWDCLFLSVTEVGELLEFVLKSECYPFLYPMCVMAAHTGARRSELCRSRTADIDLAAGTLHIREKKRSQGKRTMRTVPITPLLRGVMGEWLADKLESKFTFPEDHRLNQYRKVQLDEGCVTPDEASGHFSRALSDSKWESLRGWHVFRHSFISNCASKSIDQRMIDSWVGHQTDEMRRRYTHLFPNVQEGAIREVFADE